MKEVNIVDQTQERPKTLPEIRDIFLMDYVVPNFDQTLSGVLDSRALMRLLSGRVVRSLVEEVTTEIGKRVTERKGKRWEVKTYMVDQKTKDIFSKVGNLLADLAKISETVLLPETEDEMGCLLGMAARAIKTGKPITFYTPICPDWSRDEDGKYDFESLGGGESFIANKFFVNAPAILRVFHKHSVPFCGIILFADWGLETEINAKGTYGQELSAEDVQMCFASTVAVTDQTLKRLQEDQRLGPLFANYQIVSMKEFLTQRIDEKQVGQQMREFFTSDKQGKRLLEVLAKQSFPVNEERLGLSEDEDHEFALRNLVEYATVGSSIGGHSILVVCESSTTSRCYNLPRGRDKKVPVFYVKGKGGLDSGVNIL